MTLKNSSLANQGHFLKEEAHLGIGPRAQYHAPSFGGGEGKPSPSAAAAPHLFGSRE